MTNQEPKSAPGLAAVLRMMFLSGASDEVVENFVRLYTSESTVAGQPPIIERSIDQLVDLLDSGVLDPMLEHDSPLKTDDLPVRRYADSTPFSHEEWKRRHGVED